MKLLYTLIIGILCIFLIGCSKTNEPTAPTESTAPQIDIENVDTLADSIVELSDFLSYFVEKTYAPKSQTDIDTAVGNAVDIIDPTALFYFLRSLPKEINKESYVDISQVSYDLSEPNPSIIIRFELYLSTKYSTPKYVRFDFNEDNMITNIQEYYIK